MNDFSPSPTDNFAVLEPVADDRILRNREIRRPQRTRKPLGRILLFLLLVVVPIVGTATYLFGFAADRFESQAVFVVRNPRQADGALLAGSGRNTTDVFAQALPVASDDSFAVQEFILSRDAMRLAGEQLDLRHILAGPATDPLWHFPSIFGDDTEEALYRTYLRHVDANYDFNTNISVLSVQAFSPADAQRLAAVLLGLSEDLVNRLNERGEQDAIRAAAVDVAQAREAAQRAINDMMAFRIRAKVVDPSGSANVLSKVLVTLLGELIDTRAQIDVIRTTAPRSPQLVPLQAKADSIQRQVDNEKANIGHGDAALAPQIAEYERLDLASKFADQALMGALASQERAREQAERKQVYLDRIAAPATPDEARYPWRILDLLVVVLAAGLLFALFSPLTHGKVRHLRR
jgi:capsular polysaccharide transport system permease protein